MKLPVNATCVYVQTCDFRNRFWGGGWEEKEHAVFVRSRVSALCHTPRHRVRETCEMSATKVLNQTVKASMLQRFGEHVRHHFDRSYMFHKDVTVPKSVEEEAVTDINVFETSGWCCGVAY